MKSLSLIHTSWLRPFADYMAKRRVRLRPYLEDAKIEPQLVTSGEGWISKHKLYEFLNAVAVGEDIPELGFLVGETITPDQVGGIGAAIGEASTLGDAIRVFCRLINRSTEENRTWLEERNRPDELWLLNQTTNPFPADRRIADHAGLMSLINLVRLAGGDRWSPEKVVLQTEPTEAWTKIEGFRKTTFGFDQPATGFAFPSEWLLREIDRGSGREQLEPGPATHRLLDGNETFVKKLRRLLGNIVGVGGIGPTFKLMAELCGTSPRTLHRRLKEAGVSYQELLDEVRFESACEQLRETDTPVKALAFELGYSGANNFIRAFKRLSGLAPGEYRKRFGISDRRGRA